MILYNAYQRDCFAFAVVMSFNFNQLMKISEMNMRDKANGKIIHYINLFDHKNIAR